MTDRKKKYIKKICIKCGSQFLMSENGLASRERYNVEMLCEVCMKDRFRENAKKLRDAKREKELLLERYRRGLYGLTFKEHYEKKTGRKLRIKV